MADHAEVCVGAVVVDGRDRLLLVRRGRGPSAGGWSIPGGRVERGETLAEAVVRELWEETGLEGSVDRQIGMVELIDEVDHFVIVDFAVTLLDEDLPPRAGDDAVGVEWVDLDEVASLPGLVRGLAEFLHDHGYLTTLT